MTIEKYLKNTLSKFCGGFLCCRAWHSIERNLHSDDVFDRKDVAAKDNYLLRLYR